MIGKFSDLVKQANKEGIDRVTTALIIAPAHTVLLMRRSEGDDIMYGFWELPGGEIENGETVTEAIQRQLRDEAGLKLKKIDDYIGCFDYTVGNNKPSRRLCFSVQTDGYGITLSPRHSAYIFAGKDDLQRYNMGKEFKDLIEKYWSTEK